MKLKVSASSSSIIRLKSQSLPSVRNVLGYNLAQPNSYTHTKCRFTGIGAFKVIAYLTKTDKACTKIHSAHSAPKQKRGERKRMAIEEKESEERDDIRNVQQRFSFSLCIFGCHMRAIPMKCNFSTWMSSQLFRHILSPIST